MISRAPFIKTRFEHAVATQGVGMAAGQVSLITLEWRSTVGAQVDPVSGAEIGGTVTNNTLEVPAFIHEVGASSQVRQFAEISVGDLLVDISADVDLSTKTNLVVLARGQRYHAQRVSGRLAEIYGVIFAGLNIARTLHLRKAT